jgi:hypothetical protein
MVYFGCYMGIAWNNHAANDIPDTKTMVAYLVPKPWAVFEN